MEKQELLRRLPKVDDLLRHEAMAQMDIPAPMLTDLVRETVDSLRQGILDGTVTEVPSAAALCHEISHKAKYAALPSLREVINATGVVLHTNLGRACISQKAAQAAALAAGRYSTLEYDIAAGGRGSRYSHVEKLLCAITGAESAMVVNNNAAAVLLTLSAMAAGGEVITSRGELVEIGGSFRVPEIMEQCGCCLKEVGATNKTHLRDYRSAVGEKTRALLKVHTSNYRILGFSESVALSDLVKLGREVGLPVIIDLGSGTFFDLEQLGIHGEPTVMDSVKAGADLISFSGDKLLGGPQAGIIVGKKQYMEKIKAHPLARAVRVDKMTLAALEATLRSYLDPRTAMAEIPTLRMLCESEDSLRGRAEALHLLLRDEHVPAGVVEDCDQVGGGSVPCQTLPGWCVAVTPENTSADKLEEKLRRLPIPIVGRIKNDQYLLHVRTILEDDLYYIAQAVGEALR